MSDTYAELDPEQYISLTLPNIIIWLQYLDGEI
jgi:hypothetical protein